MNSVVRTALATGAAGLVLLFAVEAQAHVTITFEEVGADVVAAAAGTIDLTGLVFATTFTTVAGITPTLGIAEVGIVGGSMDGYSGPLTSATDFGSGGTTLASSSSGDLAGITLYPEPRVLVPQGYVSGASLSGGATFASATFASLGLTEGTYTFTWGTGGHADSLTLQVGSPTVPEPATWALMALGFAGLGAVGATARRTAAKA